MLTPRIVHLQSKDITASNGGVTLDAPAHPSEDLCIGYGIDLSGTLTDVNGGAVDAPFWNITNILVTAGWLDALLTGIVLDAPRVGGNLVESTVSGRHLAFLFEAMFGRDIYRTKDVVCAHAGAARSVGLRLFIPFMDPDSQDPYFAAIPCHLLKGDVSLKLVSGPLTSTVTAGGGGGGVGTLSAMKARWSALVVKGSGNEVPVRTKIALSTFTTDTYNLGPGFPAQILDMRDPEGGAVADYTVKIDDEEIVGQATPQELLGAFSDSVDPSLDAESTNWTPLHWLSKQAQPSRFRRASRNVAVKMTGATTATVLTRFLLPPDENIEARVAAANGVAAPGTGGTISLPKAPSGQATTLVDEKVAAGGPRVIMVDNGSIVAPPPRVTGSRPKVPAVPSQMVDTGGAKKAITAGFTRIGSSVNRLFGRG